VWIVIIKGMCEGARVLMRPWQEVAQVSKLCLVTGVEKGLCQSGFPLPPIYKSLYMRGPAVQKYDPKWVPPEWLARAKSPFWLWRLRPDSKITRRWHSKLFRWSTYIGEQS
jgi:hypothetical protein